MIVFFFFLNAALKDLEINANITRGCRLGDQFHPAGSSWYPYLPPNGFDRCATCTCNAITLEVKCPRVQCPPLTCSEKIAYRPNKSACCRKCPEVNVESKKNDNKLIEFPFYFSSKTTFENKN